MMDLFEFDFDWSRINHSVCCEEEIGGLRKMETHGEVIKK